MRPDRARRHAGPEPDGLHPRRPPGGGGAGPRRRDSGLGARAVRTARGMVGPGGALRALAVRPGHRLVYYCAFGERSAMAVDMSRECGLEDVCHLIGGVAAWREAGGSLGEG